MNAFDALPGSFNHLQQQAAALGKSLAAEPIGSVSHRQLLQQLHQVRAQLNDLRATTRHGFLSNI